MTTRTTGTSETVPRARTTGRLAWGLVGAAVLVQIVYPLVPEALDTAVTVTSVIVFFLAALADVVRVHGARGGVALVLVAGGGGLLAEAVGLATGVPFGSYAYTGTLGAEVLGVPLVVPLAWAMMAWPALVVGRALAVRGLATVAVGAVALATWDLFLDPQMVAAGHWSWADPAPAMPLVPDVPLTNYAGWLLVSLLVIGGLHLALGPRRGPVSAPASALYLWVYASSVLAHLAFFGLPGSALVGGIGMGLVAVPFAVATWRRRAG
ncbi:carotenoid biosynthesis protein [Actinomycetospora termitidis]|uniref:Carotenoid biosynthesis protein n=1 Tax=Actinomycetospora termitidis TaxID=3053470 RepID=A0ABT7M3K8_9PSEU|nr:carotenoid biosynthesis protein [Actinomycetospora sp. Odt1-22]MDL5154799.1 carotenoid biosynthesis protein [Actinomycetospora sp. Odt1-22]